MTLKHSYELKDPKIGDLFTIEGQYHLEKRTFWQWLTIKPKIKIGLKTFKVTDNIGSGSVIVYTELIIH